MPKTNTSVQSVKNSNGNAPAFDKLTKAELIELLQSNVKNPIKDFAKKFAKSKSVRIFALANRCPKHQQETYYNAIKRCPLSTFGYAEGVCSQNMTGQRLFLLPYTLNF
jgi:hypothetical protein